MADLNLNRLAYFAAVAETGSFTRAADRLGVAKTLVSQHIARLETELGTSLLVRTTRRVRTTEAGRSLYEHAVLILKSAHEALAALSEANGTPHGVLRISAPNDFGTFVIAPLAARFCAENPAVSVDLRLSDNRIDLLENDIDLAIRVGWLTDSSHQARKLGTFRQLAVTVASAAKGLKISHPRELAELPYVANSALKDPTIWTFTRVEGDDWFDLQLRPRLTVSTTPAALSSTLAGGGFTILPDFLIQRELDTGILIQLAPEWTLPDGGVYVVYPAARFRPPKVIAFVDMLSAQARQHCRSGQNAAR